MKPAKLISVMAAIAILAFSLCSCTGGGHTDLPEPAVTTTTADTVQTEPQETAPDTAQASQTAPTETTAPETPTVITTEEVTQMATTTEITQITEITETMQTSTTTQAYKVEPASGVMYAVDRVNVRSGPATTYERIGHLDKGEKVEIIGVVENGWYKIKFEGGEYFVGGSYLTTEMPAENTPTTTATTPELAPTTTSAPVTAIDNSPGTDEEENTAWIATWGTAMLTAGTEQTPTKPSLDNNTLRQQIRVSVGGQKLRLVISNEYGKTNLEIEKITIAKISNPKKPDIQLDTAVELTVDGKTSFTVKAGKRVTTDVLDFEFDPLEDLAITMKLGSVPSVLTCHTASRCSTWITERDHVSDNNYAGCEEMTAWYFITELDTLASEDSGVIVCLGDSLTDGASVTTNGFSRYTDELARRLQADDNLKNLAVANMGIGATALYTYGGDIAGTNRMNRDVLKVPGVKYCVLLMGVNDIGGAQTDISSDIIREYKSIIKRCHNRGIKVFGCTLTPFKGNSYYSDLHEKIRLKVNEFVLSEDSGFDAVIDLSSAVASSSDSAKMDSKYVSTWNDYLHFNDSGYKFVGKTVYQHIKEYIEKENKK